MRFPPENFQKTLMINFLKRQIDIQNVLMPLIYAGMFS